MTTTVRLLQKYTLSGVPYAAGDLVAINDTTAAQLVAGKLADSGSNAINRAITEGEILKYPETDALTYFLAEPVPESITPRVSIAYLTGKSAERVGSTLYLDGVSVGSTVAGAPTNYIGIAGAQGFGVGLCKDIPFGFSKMSGTDDIASENYGNYKYTDGSIMCWIPAFYYKIGTGSNGLTLNNIDIRYSSYFQDISAANILGYAMHRAFYNAGAIQTGVFVDKYQCSNNSGIASSIKFRNPLSSALEHNPFSGLTGLTTDDNIYAGAIKAAKTRGVKFFCSSRFIFSALALLSLAHAQAATSTTACAWYDAEGVTNFPKGNNNNALKDTNDATVTYITDGYLNCGQTGSASNLAKTAHNGQSCGVVDLSGNLWEINPGITSDGASFYLLKTSVDIAALTGNASLNTDLWGAAGITANYDLLGTTYESLTASSTQKYFNSTAQVFSESVSGNTWAATGAGIPLLSDVSTGGTNAMGNDGLWDYRPSQLCSRAGGSWYDGAGAGVWALHLSYHRVNSLNTVGFRSALYP